MLVHEGQSTYEKLHLGYLLIHLFHELDDKINQLMLQHLLRMEICYQERYVVSLRKGLSISLKFKDPMGTLTNLHRLSP